MQSPGVRETAAQMFAALDHRDWDKAAAFVDTGEAAAFRQRILEMLSVRVAGLDTTRTGGVLITGALVPDLLRAHPTLRLAQLRGKETVADIVALTPHEFLAGAIEITQRRLYQEAPGDVSPRVNWKIERVKMLDDSTANVHYSLKITGVALPPQALVLPMRRHARRWYATPGGELVSQLILLDYLLKGTRGS